MKHRTRSRRTGRHSPAGNAGRFNVPPPQQRCIIYEAVAENLGGDVWRITITTTPPIAAVKTSPGGIVVTTGLDETLIGTISKTKDGKIIWTSDGPVNEPHYFTVIQPTFYIATNGRPLEDDGSQHELPYP